MLVAWQAATGRFALVTDAAPAAGTGDGVFVLGGREVHAADGVVRGPEGQLAGSALTMIEGVRNLQSLGIPLEDALRAASEVPARVAQRPDLGRLVPGAPADIVVLDDRLDVVRVLVDGRRACRSRVVRWRSSRRCWSGCCASRRGRSRTRGPRSPRAGRASR